MSLFVRTDEATNSRADVAADVVEPDGPLRQAVTQAVAHTCRCQSREDVQLAADAVVEDVLELLTVTWLCVSEVG